MTKEKPTTTPPELTVFGPHNNDVVNLNQPFPVTGQVTNQHVSGEPVMIDSVTVQIDGGPLIDAPLKIIPDKTLTKVSFQASAQITGGSDPHTVTVVATNDQQLRATKTITVFAGSVFQVDAPAVLLDVRTLISITANGKQVLTFIGKVQRQLGSLSDTLASAGKVLIGPNLIVQPINPSESLVRIGFWIENPGFPVVPPSADFPLPRLSDAAAAAAFAATPVLEVPNPGPLSPSFALSIPATTLQHLIDATAPTLKSEASKQGFAVDTITAQTSPPATVNTNVSGHVLKGAVPASFTISETVGLKPVAGGPSVQQTPAVLKTDSSSSVGSLLEWIAGYFEPLIGGTLAYAFYKVSSAASEKSGLASSFLGSIPARIPFGNKDVSLDPNFKMPDFPSFDLSWNTFGATSTGLLGTGTSDINARTEADVKVILNGPDSFTGFPETIQELSDPTMGYILQNITPDSGKFGWKIFGAGSNADSIEPPSPVVQAGDFFPHFPLPLKINPPADIHFNLAINATETCQSDPTKTLTGGASKAILFRVKKKPEGQ
jgi:hypothetical protein